MPGLLGGTSLPNSSAERVKNTEPFMAAATTAPSKAKSASRPKFLVFKGTYDIGKVCIEIRQGLAMYDVHKFKLVEMTQGSKDLQDRFPKPNTWFNGFGRPRGYSAAHLIVGETYTVRIVPSDETWSRIEQADESISLDGDELEVFPNAKSGSSK